MTNQPFETLTLSSHGGWVRDFPGEYPPITAYIRALLGRLAVRPTAIDGDRQAQFFDTSFYFRLGGLDPDKVERNADMLIIQAGIGSRMAETLPEHVQIAKDKGKRYATYLIPDVDDPMPLQNQVDNWFEWPGVAQAPLVSDIEKPRSTTRVITPSEFRILQLRMKSLSPFLTWTYSRVNIFETLFPQGFPDWLSDVYQWIAQYYLTSQGLYYKYFQDWLNVFAWMLPGAVTRSFLYRDLFWRNRVKAWQISPKFDGEFYLAPPYIAPGQPGIKSVDGNVSIETKRTFLSYFPEPGTAPPIEPPIPEVGNYSDQFKTLYEGQNFRTEPTAAGGDATVIKQLPKGAIITAVPCTTANKPYTGVKVYAPGLSRPQEIWVHGIEPEGSAGWIAIYHPQKTNVWAESIPPLFVPNPS